MGGGHVHDPVCGMWIDSATAAAVAEHAGQSYFFCDPGCRAAFLSDPERYAEPGTVAHDRIPGVTIGQTTPPRPCPACGSHVETLDTLQEHIGDLPVDEFAALVRARWRRRLGRRAYRREHSTPLIRALAAHALEPASPIRMVVLEEELTLEVARLRADGLNRPQVGRELYHLARVAADVLAGCGLETAQAAPMIETIDRRLRASWGTAHSWHEPHGRTAE